MKSSLYEENAQTRMIAEAMKGFTKVMLKSNVTPLYFFISLMFSTVAINYAAIVPREAPFTLITLIPTKIYVIIIFATAPIARFFTGTFCLFIP